MSDSERRHYGDDGLGDVLVRLGRLETLVEERFTAVEQARSLAQENLDARLDKLNELRSEVMTDRVRFLATDKYEVLHVATVSRIEKLEHWQTRVLGVIAGVTAVAGVVGGFVSKFIP